MTEENMVGVIKLSVPEGKRMLSGKEVGVNARAEHNLDNLDKVEGYVQIDIPVPVVTSSFILGMFSKSVQTLGLEKFFDKYRFNARDEIIRNIEVNAKYSITEGTALN